MPQSRRCIATPSAEAAPARRLSPAGRRRPAPWWSPSCCSLTACGSTAPDPPPPPHRARRPTAPPAARSRPRSSIPRPSTRRSRTRSIAIRGLKPKTKVDPKLLDDAGIKKYIADTFANDNPPDVVEANERMLKALGLLPAGRLAVGPVRQAARQPGRRPLHPDDKKLYVVSRSGGLGAAEKTTFAHEFTHALQDQNFDLGIAPARRDRPGRPVARPPGAGRGRRHPAHEPLAAVQNLTRPTLGQMLAEPATTRRRRSSSTDAADPPRVAPVPVHSRA